MAGCFSPCAVTPPPIPFIFLVPAAQVTPSSHPKKDHVSDEDLSKESFISKEELVSKENVVKRAKSQKPMPQEDNFKNVKLQLEETTERAPRAGMSQGRGKPLGRY